MWRSLQLRAGLLRNGEPRDRCELIAPRHSGTGSRGRKVACNLVSGKGSSSHRSSSCRSVALVSDFKSVFESTLVKTAGKMERSRGPDVARRSPTPLQQNYLPYLSYLTSWHLDHQQALIINPWPLSLDLASKIIITVPPTPHCAS